jgi:hypothetical protein
MRLTVSRLNFASRRLYSALGRGKRCRVWGGDSARYGTGRNYVAFYFTGRDATTGMLPTSVRQSPREEVLHAL